MDARILLHGGNQALILDTQVYTPNNVFDGNGMACSACEMSEDMGLLRPHLPYFHPRLKVYSPAC